MRTYREYTTEPKLTRRDWLPVLLALALIGIGGGIELAGAADQSVCEYPVDEITALELQILALEERLSTESAGGGE